MPTVPIKQNMISKINNRLLCFFRSSKIFSSLTHIEHPREMDKDPRDLIKVVEQRSCPCEAQRDGSEANSRQTVLANVSLALSPSPYWHLSSATITVSHNTNVFDWSQSVNNI